MAVPYTPPKEDCCTSCGSGPLLHSCRIAGTGLCHQCGHLRYAKIIRGWNVRGWISMAISCLIAVLLAMISMNPKVVIVPCDRCVDATNGGEK